MPNHTLLYPFVTPPSHRRTDIIFSFGFSLMWIVLYALDQRLFTLPYPFLPGTFLLKGIAEILPRSWIVPAAGLRITSLIFAIIGTIWILLQVTGKL